MAKSFGISFSIGAKVGASVNSAFASVQDKLRQTQAVFSKANQQSKMLDNAVNARLKLDNARARLRAEGGDANAVAQIGRLAEQYARAAREAGVYGQSLAEMTRKQKEFARSIKLCEGRLNALNTIQNGRNIRSAASDTRQRAMSGLVADAGTIYGMAAPVKIGLQFDSAMSRVSAVSGAVGADFDHLRNQARELGASTVWSAKEAAEGMTFLSMAGFKTKDTMAAMPGMLSLASAGAMDLASTADIASNILSGFGMEADKMTYVSDVMAKTFTNSNTSIASLGESMKYCAPAAQLAKQNFQDVAAMVGKLGDAGIQGSMAGTALNAIMLRMSAPPKMAADAMRMLNLQMADANGKMRALPDVLAELGAKTQNMKEIDRVEFFRNIFGMENAKAGQILVEQALSGAIQSMSESLYEEGYAEDVAKKQNDNLLGDLKALNSAYEEMGLCLSDVVSPALRTITQNLIPVVRSIGEWISANPRLVQGITLVGGAFMSLKVAGVALTIINSYGKTLSGSLVSLRGHAMLAGNTIRSQFTRPVGNPFISAQSGAERLRLKLAQVRQAYQQTSMSSIWAGSKAAVSGTMAAAGRVGWNTLRLGIKGVGLAFKTAFGPMSLLMMGLSMGAEYIMEHWDKIQPYFEALWEGVKKIFNTVADWLKPIIDKITAFISPIASAAGKIGNAIGALWDKIVGNDKAKEKIPIKTVPEVAVKTPEQLQQEKEWADEYANIKEDFAKRQAEEKERQKAEKKRKTRSRTQISVPAMADNPDDYAAMPVSGGSRGTNVNVQVSLNVTQNGVPDQTFAQGVINALKSRQSDFEQIISNLVNEQARLAYGG